MSKESVNTRAIASHLTSFLEVCRTGSIGSAGQNLGISGTAARNRIAVLEEELGFALTTQHGRFKLTPEGEALRNYCLKIYEELMGSASSVIRLVTGVRIVVQQDRASLINEALEGREDAPFKLQVSISKSSIEALRELQRGNASIGVVSSSWDDDEFEFARLNSSHPTFLVWHTSNRVVGHMVLEVLQPED